MNMWLILIMLLSIPPSILASTDAERLIDECVVEFETLKDSLDRELCAYLLRTEADLIKKQLDIETGLSALALERHRRIKMSNKVHAYYHKAQLKCAFKIDNIKKDVQAAISKTLTMLHSLRCKHGQDKNPKKLHLIMNRIKEAGSRGDELQIQVEFETDRLDKMIDKALSKFDQIFARAKLKASRSYFPSPE